MADDRIKTTHLHLVKPQYEEDADIKDINDNMDLIDAAIYALQTAGTNMAALAPAFVQSTPNEVGTYVTYEGEFYFLPDGHDANVTWANTTKTKTNVGTVLTYLKDHAGAQIDDTAGAGNITNVWSANKIVSTIDTILGIIAPKFVQATANEEGTYVTYNNAFYFLPDGHTANTTWENTTKVQKNIGEVLTYLKDNASVEIDDTAGLGDTDVVWSANKVALNINKKINSPAGNGTAGQLLTTNGDGSTSWTSVGQPTDEQTANAVSAWLLAHPEATTTVEDGSITKQKLYSGVVSELEGKAEAVINSTDLKNTFSKTELNALDDYSIESDATGHSSVLVSKYEDLCPLTEAFTNSTGTIHKEANINVVTADGTPTSNASYYAKVNAHAYITPKEAISTGETVYFAISVDGTITGEGTTPGRIELQFKYTDESMASSTAEYGMSGGLVTGSLTATKEVQYIYVTILFRKDYTFDVDATWAVSKVAFSSVTVPASGVVKFGAAEVGYDGFTIIPTPAVAKHKVSIEDYVEAHVPEDMLTKEDLVYLSPEMYGAKGDGVTNDAAAIQSCINAAITAGVPVRAYGKYLVGTGIDIVGSYMDIFINYIELASSSSSGYAVRLSGRNNIIVFKQVSAYSTSGACGMRLATTETGDNVQYNNITIARIDGYTNAIELINNYKSASKSIYYNTLRVGTIVGRLGNCIYTSGGAMNENSFWGKRATCNSGYFVYNYGWTGDSSNKFYEFCIENNCENGVYGFATLINCRTTECMDLKRPDNDKGMIFRVVDTTPNGCHTQNTVIDYIAFDNSGAMTYAEMVAAAKEILDNDHSASRAYVNARTFLGASGDCVVGDCYRLWNYYAVESSLGYGSQIPRGKVIAYFNHKGFVPNIPWEREISASSYTPLVTEPFVPTIFVIKANTSIYFNYSYCCVGNNDIKIVQTDGYKATVYDKFGNVIFDGTQQTDGTYRLTCTMFDKTITITRDDEVEIVFDTDIRGIYFGDNEKWTVEKLNIIS